MNYRIMMEPEAWDKFWTLVKIAPGEVGCFGYCKIDKEREEIIVDEVFLVPQESSAAQVDFIESGLPYALEKAATDDRLEDLHFCIHSHGSFGTMWSSTDEDMIKTMGLTADWFVSVIFNKEGKSNGRIDTWNLPPFGRCQVILKDIPVEMIVSEAFEDRMIEEFQHFVKEPPKVQSKTWTPKGGPVKKEEPAKSKELVKVTPEDIREAIGSALGEWKESRSIAELADELGWECFVADGIRYWYDELTNEVVHEEKVLDDRFDQLLDAGL